MDTESSSSTMSVGWIFIVLLLFFGIFGGWGNGGLFGRSGGSSGSVATTDSGSLIGSEINSITDLMALKGMEKSANSDSNNRMERELLDLKYTTGTQNAVLTQQLETAFRTIISNQDKGFSEMRIQQLNDQLSAQNMTLMNQNAEINALKNQMYNDSRFNAIERQIEAGFAQTVTRPPFYPYGCTPCCSGSSSCSGGTVVG